MSWTTKTGSATSVPRTSKTMAWRGCAKFCSGRAHENSVRQLLCQGVIQLPDVMANLAARESPQRGFRRVIATEVSYPMHLLADPRYWPSIAIGHPSHIFHTQFCSRRVFIILEPIPNCSPLTFVLPGCRHVDVGYQQLNIVCAVIGGFIALFGLVAYLAKERFHLKPVS